MNTKGTALELTAECNAQLLQRIEALAALSESPTVLTRRFATPQHHQANELTAGWMREAGMQVHEDTIGNIIGRYEGQQPDAPAILIGSHLDTVVDGGKYDGMLGVLSGLACVEALNLNNIRLPVAIELVGFADEEGVRYQSTFLGSRAIAGTFDMSLLETLDKDGISMADALRAFGKNPDELLGAVRRPDEFVAFLELHIEQGPVLEQQNVPVAAVSAIAGATRLNVAVTGDAGHAGTVPMRGRHDALCAAALCITAIETLCTGSADLVGTVGRIDVSPGAGNVIPGLVDFSVDIRAATDQRRKEAVGKVTERLKQICAERDLQINISLVHDAGSVDCDDKLIQHVSDSINALGYKPLTLASGAGHDASAIADIMPVCMVFVRCAGGISHNPAESVTDADAAVGAQVLLDSVLRIAAATSVDPAKNANTAPA